MTMQTNLTLPPPGYPLVTRVISNALFPEVPPRADPEPVTWVLGQPHPFVPTMTVVRMFVIRGGGVEVYSMAPRGEDAMRNLLPMHWVRFVEEAMPLDIFIDELAAAEAGDDDEPGGPGDPGDPGYPGDPLPDALGDPANGQAGPTVST